MITYSGKTLMWINQRISEKRLFGHAVEALKTDTPGDKSKCPSDRGVRLIEVLQNCLINFYVTLQISLNST